MSLRTFPLPVKVLATCFLLTIGLGYFFALVYLYLIDIEPHARQGIGLVASVIMKYYGQREGSRLEAALEGNMGENITTNEKNQIIKWIRQGAPEAQFGNIQPLLKQNCAGCHSPDSGLPIPPLTTYTEVSKYTGVDLGQSVKALVRVSHIHLFGLSLIFVLSSMIFVFSETSRLFRSVLIGIPFMAIWIDVGSWWFTKYDPFFAYTVIGGGALMGLSLAAQIGISLYEIWLAPPKKSQTS